jgi:putative sterol carrier protein
MADPAPPIDPAEAARAVAGATDDQLAEGMKSENREMILDQVFDQMERHIKPEQAKTVGEAVILWKITGRADGGADVYEAVIKDGGVTVNKESTQPPRVTFTLDGVDFLKLVTNNVQGPELFMTGKLKLEGDMMFAAQLPALFTIPSAAGGTGSPAGA